MKKIILSSIVVFILAFSMVVTPAAAAPPQAIYIDSALYFADGQGPFTASGTAVVAGLFCASGTVVDIGGKMIRLPTEKKPGIVRVHKHFNCDADIIEMNMVVTFNENGSTANWQILGGSGVYARLSGHGVLVGTPIGQEGMHDVYDGMVNIPGAP
jgi:hypothetical protein